MDNNIYLQKIQEYLDNNNIQNDSNENVSLNKNQLLECFQMILNSKEQSNSNNNIKQEETPSNLNMKQIQDSINKMVQQNNQKANKNTPRNIPPQAKKNKDIRKNNNEIKKNNNKFIPNNNNNNNININEMPIKSGGNFNEL